MRKLNKIIVCILLIVFTLSFNISTVTALAESIEESKDLSEQLQEEQEKEEEEDTNTNEQIEYKDEDIKEDTEQINDSEDIGEDLTEKIEQEPTNILKSQEGAPIKTISNVPFSAQVENTKGYKIKTYLKNGVYYLFLSKDIDISKLSIKYQYGSEIKNVTPQNGATIDNAKKTLTYNFNKSNNISLNMKDGKSFKIKVMQSDIPSVCINLNDNVKLKTLTSGSKDKKYAASLKIAGTQNGKYDLEDSGIEIKGRGNSTWTLPKKPFQIKLSSKQNLLGMKKSGKAKKWILLANQLDRTLMKNKLIDDLQEEMGLSSDNMNGEFVDLYINGEFLGNYLLCEKVEIGENRINLTNQMGIIGEIDKAYAENEPDTPSFRTNKTKTVIGVKESYAGEELKDSKKEKKALSQFKEYINKFEDLIYQDNPNWNEIKKMIDVDSFIKYYLITELAEDPDRFISSTFIWKDGPNDVLHIGPVWDNDTAIGYHVGVFAGGETNVDYNLNFLKNRCQGETYHKTNWYEQLYRNKEFVKLINEEYQKSTKNVFLSIQDKIEDYKNNMEKSIQMNYVVWDMKHQLPTAHTYKGSYEGEVNYLKKWLYNRVNYMNMRYGNEYQITYNTYVKDEGWKDNWALDGQVSGTQNMSRAIQQIKITSPNFSSKQHIKYKVHVEDYGWMNYKKDGNTVGVQGKKIEAIKINLVNIPGYNITYRVHVQDIGWMDWVKNGKMAGTTGKNKAIEAIEIKIEKSTGLGVKNPTKNADITYRAHIQDIGWSQWGYDGDMIGTTGKSKQLEALTINVNKEKFKDLSLSYQVHVQDIGWMNWKSSGQNAGTTGKSKRLEAIKIKVNNKAKYTVSYRVHVQDIGWMDWKTNGQIAGTTGKGKRIEAIEIKLEQRQFMGTAKVDKDSGVLYQSHISDIGWTKTGADGQTIGTQGLAKQVEAIKINLKQSLGLKVKYRVHAKDIGWMDWKTNGELAGTTRQNKRIEAFQIKLTNTNKYDIKYRAHVSNIGWMNWRKNGQTAGTVSLGLPVEAMQVKLQNK